MNVNFICINSKRADLSIGRVLRFSWRDNVGPAAVQGVGTVGRPPSRCPVTGTGRIWRPIWMSGALLMRLGTSGILVLVLVPILLILVGVILAASGVSAAASIVPQTSEISAAPASLASERGCCNGWCSVRTVSTNGIGFRDGSNDSWLGV